MFKVIKDLEKGTVVRTLLQIFIYVNQVLVIFGQTPLAESMLYLWISFIATVVVTGITYWYDNDWTKFAKLSTRVYDMLKDGQITEEELRQFAEEHKK